MFLLAFGIWDIIP